MVVSLKSCIRVEFNGNVPNAPCGVERSFLSFSIPKFYMFLMHRVELKVYKVS
jgi:hypothetical protein